MVTFFNYYYNFFCNILLFYAIINKLVKKEGVSYGNKKRCDYCPC